MSIHADEPTLPNADPQNPPNFSLGEMPTDGTAEPNDAAEPDAAAKRNETATPDSAMTNQIHAALSGENIQTGDGFLDDMLQVLQHRGSILDGSSLDYELPSDDIRQGADKAFESQNARVAESLLKSARLLEKLGKLSAEQTELVAQLRSTAGRLLSNKLLSRDLLSGERATESN